MFRDLLSAFGLGTKKIQQILNKEEIEGEPSRLEQLLNEEETIQEAKQQNQKLIEFLSKRENLIQLVSFATRTPTDPSNKASAFK